MKKIKQTRTVEIGTRFELIAAAAVECEYGFALYVWKRVNGRNRCLSIASCNHNAAVKFELCGLIDDAIAENC